MSDPTVQLESTTLRVEAGNRVQTVVTIGNFNDYVEGYRLTVLGDQVAGFASVVPDSVEIYPGKQVTALVAFTLPVGNTAASGSFPFAVEARSTVTDSSSSAVAEGDLEIDRFYSLKPKLVPKTSNGRWRGRHQFTVVNGGNLPVQLKLTATDQDEKLGFLLIPERLELPVGVTGYAQVRVRTRRPMLRGTPGQIPFQILAELDPPDPTPMTALAVARNDRTATIDGVFLQKPILSRFVVLAITIALLLVGGGVAYALTRPAAIPKTSLGHTLPTKPALAIAKVDPTTLSATWDEQSGVDLYRLYSLTDGHTALVKELSGTETTFAITGLIPGSTHCYFLRAVKDNEFGPQSAPPACETTDTAPVSETTSPNPSETTATATAEPTSAAPSATTDGPTSVAATTTGESPTSPASPDGGTTSGTPIAGFQPGQFVLVRQVTPANDSGNVAGLDAVRDSTTQQLTGTGFTAAVLNTSDYPQLLVGATTFPSSTFLVYVGPFASDADAQAFCGLHPGLFATVGSACETAQPAG